MGSADGGLGRTLFYRCARRIFVVLARMMFRFRVEGAERLPRRGPGVLVASHRSWLDPACVGGACRRPVRFLILDTIYRKRWARWFYCGLGAIPVSPRTAPSGVRRALRHLRGGGLIGVFPEGRVFAAGRPGELRPGAALLSIRAGAPVIPLWIDGSAAAWPRRRHWPRPAPIRVRVGSPIAPPPPGTRDGRGDLVRRIEAVLSAGAVG